ncbi:MAG: hypothetical protein WCV80_01445 [Candidatus Paceibacterota bacterium]
MTKQQQEVKKCSGCDENATWIRHTQFAGNHPFCAGCAKKEKDFRKRNSTVFWEWIPGKKRKMKK